MTSYEKGSSSFGDANVPSLSEAAKQLTTKNPPSIPPVSTAARLWKAVAIIALLASTTPASAQRTADNALRSAQDAFGSSVGNESIGLYSPSSVRGFSPFSAGNVRVEGLYYDAAVGFNGRLVRGSTVRVGISAQGYPFPAPTGIADYRLRLPGKETALSLVATADSYEGQYLEADGQIPLIEDKLALSVGAHRSNDVYSFSGSGTHSSAATILHWRPTKSIEVIPFWSGYIHHGMDLQPAILVPSAADFLPPKIERGRYLSQPWAIYKGRDANYGTIARWKKDGTTVAAGAFRSVSTTRDVYSDLFTNVSEGGLAANHLISASPPQKYSSTSGELRASQSFLEGRRSHTFHVAARARDRKRRYGGSSVVDLGPVVVNEAGAVSKPDFAFGKQTRDRVKQLSGGLGYEGRWAGVGELTLGLQRVTYRKDIARPELADPPTEASPWLYNAGAAISVSPTLALYAGLTRGLEESPVAPSTAVNRDEAPPAILTSQYDGGLRWAITQKVRLVAGLFNVEKPYFSMDSGRVYRRLGQVRHRGAELSVIAEAVAGLNILAGAVLLDAEVSGEAVEAGSIGRRPVASTPRSLLISADYSLPWVPGLSVDINVTGVGKRTANAANTVAVPPMETVGLGARYQTKLGGTPVTFRLQGSNIFNTYSWNVLSSGAYFYSGQRQISLRVAADF